MTETVNLVEGILWIVIGFCFAISLIRPGWRRAKLLATFDFLVFGLSASLAQDRSQVRLRR